MRRLIASALLLGACWVGPAYVTEPPHPRWCLTAPVPNPTCEGPYVWVNQSYRYRGQWHGGRYVVRDHRR